jgi:transcriptional regulator with XRE-family HTH domain
MPASPDTHPRDRDEVLSRVLKAIRNHRGLTVQQVATGMGMKKRTYEHFEAGEGLLKLDRIFAFATATDSDPYAIQAAVRLDMPEFALACIDNKLCMLLVAHAREIFRREGAGLSTLPAQAIVEALEPAFAAMAAELQRARELAGKWFGPGGAGGQSR